MMVTSKKVQNLAQFPFCWSSTFLKFFNMSHTPKAIDYSSPQKASSHHAEIMTSFWSKNSNIFEFPEKMFILEDSRLIFQPLVIYFWVGIRKIQCPDSKGGNTLICSNLGGSRSWWWIQGHFKLGRSVVRVMKMTMIQKKKVFLVLITPLDLLIFWQVFKIILEKKGNFHTLCAFLSEFWIFFTLFRCKSKVISVFTWLIWHYRDKKSVSYWTSEC